MSSLVLAWRLARRELRGGLGGFVVFLACLTLGVAAIAAVGVINAGVLEGLKRDASALLGGDIRIDASNLPLTEDELRGLIPPGAKRSDLVRTNAMAQGAGGRRVVVALKAVDDAYPLYGAVGLDPPTISLDQALADRWCGGRARAPCPARAEGWRQAADRRGRLRHPRRDRARAGSDRRLRQHRAARDDPPRSARADADHPAGLSRPLLLPPGAAGGGQRRSRAGANPGRASGCPMASTRRA